MNDQPAQDFVIEIDHLTKYYGKREIVADLSLQIPRGTIYGFLGRYGMGKTTTIRIFLGLEDPTRGGSRVFGLDSRRLPRRLCARPALGSLRRATTAAVGFRKLTVWSIGCYGHNPLAPVGAGNGASPDDQRDRRCVGGRRAGWFQERPAGRDQVAFVIAG